MDKYNINEEFGTSARCFKESIEHVDFNRVDSFVTDLIMTGLKNKYANLRDNYQCLSEEEKLNGAKKEFRGCARLFGEKKLELRRLEARI